MPWVNKFIFSHVKVNFSVLKRRTEALKPIFYDHRPLIEKKRSAVVNSYSDLAKELMHKEISFFYQTVDPTE